MQPRVNFNAENPKFLFILPVHSLATIWTDLNANVYRRYARYILKVTTKCHQKETYINLISNLIRRHIITTLVLRGSGSLRVGKRIEGESFALSETDDDGDCRIRIASTDETLFYIKIHINRHNSFRTGGTGGGGQQKSHMKFRSSKAVHVHQNCTCRAGFYKVRWWNQIFLQETSLRNHLS